MNRRDFLKQILGFSISLAIGGVALPTRVKGAVVAPITKLTANAFINETIRQRITDIKTKHPSWKLGETHCHSLFSDGNFNVSDLIHRSSRLGLDFLVITEHQIPKLYNLNCSLRSFTNRSKIIDEWNEKENEPIKLYPGIETSTQQGHMISVFPEDFLQIKNHNDIKSLYGPFDILPPQMELAAKHARLLNGVTIIPHPEIQRRYPFGAKVSFIRKHLTGLVDAIEDISSGHGYETNHSKQLNLASIGSSDDHFNLFIGTTVTSYDSKRHSNLLSAIRAKETTAIKIDNSLQPLVSAGRIIL
tara:strand:- start:5699 stop:6607 length:909 start_codon:yes stop_codon:yes gene_type:complete